MEPESTIEEIVEPAADVEETPVADGQGIEVPVTEAEQAAAVPGPETAEGSVTAVSRQFRQIAGLDTQPE